MKKRVFWIGSLVLILLASSFHLEGIKADQGRALRLGSAEYTIDIERKQTLKTEAKQLGDKSEELILLGRVVGVLSVIGFYFSYRRHEPVHYIISIALLVFFALLEFVGA
jgi:hypothetical protein